MHCLACLAACAAQRMNVALLASLLSSWLAMKALRRSLAAAGVTHPGPLRPAFCVRCCSATARTATGCPPATLASTACCCLRIAPRRSWQIGCAWPYSTRKGLAWNERPALDWLCLLARACCSRP
jgi:hypothetical protein